MSREYFDEGCLCVLSGKIETAKTNDDNALQFYLDNCTCSRHPESSTRSCWDREDPITRKGALSLIAKRHSSIAKHHPSLK
jgi:hypothetical protein